ncbi:MAG TPA: YcnI family protein [Acidimicrobiia bacterium]|nr:YcnI family protein [Acidimicrobiia bacterium]
MTRNAGRLGVVTVVVALGLALVGGGVASAHVTVKPSSAPGGGFEVISFNVPNEKDDADTVKLEVEIPTKNPIAFVSVQPMTGWTIAVEKTTLAKPVKAEGGEITEAVSKITWTATAGGLEPGQFDLFTISAGPLPTKVKKLEFKALQTYSDGEVVRWIQPTVKGAPEPENPVPTLTITKAGSSDHH